MYSRLFLHMCGSLCSRHSWLAEPSVPVALPPLANSYWPLLEISAQSDPSWSALLLCHWALWALFRFASSLSWTIHTLPSPSLYLARSRSSVTAEWRISHKTLFPVNMQRGGKSRAFLFLEHSQICVVIHSAGYPVPTMCIPSAFLTLATPTHIVFLLTPSHR